MPDRTRSLPPRGCGGERDERVRASQWCPGVCPEQAFGGFLLTQDIMRHFGMSLEEAESGKRTGFAPESYESDLLAALHGPWRLKCRVPSILLYLDPVQPGGTIVLAGGCAVIPGLAETVSGRTQVDTHIANPFARMSLGTKIRPKSLSADAPALLVACGLALRRFDS